MSLVQVCPHMNQPISGVARSLAARCGCQICRTSVFGNTEELIQPYCLHILAQHRNTVTRSVSQNKASNFHFQFQSGRRLPWLRWHNLSRPMLWFFAALSYVRACVCLSVCPTNANNASKLMTVGSCGSHLRVTQIHLVFLLPTFYFHIPYPREPLGGFKSKRGCSG